MLSVILERLRSLGRNENYALALTAIVVGLLAGLAAVALRETIRGFTVLFLKGEGIRPGQLTDYLRLLAAPALGGLLAGPLIARGASEAKGHGVPEVMEAVALKGGRIRGRVAVIKTVASALTIGSGGSAGREGPIVQVGATLGSKVGQMLKMSAPRIRTLVACGAAAGIAAAFNAPLAGMFFALEVILQRFTARGVAAVALSAVTSSFVWRSAFGNQPVLDVQEFALVSASELVFYLILGVLAAVTAVGFVKSLYWCESLFEKARIPEDIKPAIGGLLLGVVGIGTAYMVGEPLIFGDGLRGINLALGSNVVWWAMLILIGAKIVGTSLTLGSGASGGVFSPSLFMGAMLGGAIGQAVNALLPFATAPAPAYSMVGMAAVFSAAAQAPISSILILFEMTNDYLIILPLMLSCIVATVAYSVMQNESIYTMKLSRRGIVIAEGREQHLLERIPVSRAMDAKFAGISITSELEEAQRACRNEGAEWLVVVELDGTLAGTISADGVSEALEQEVLPSLQALVEAEPPSVQPSDSLQSALRRLAPRGVRLLPVTEDSTGKVVGVVTRDSLLGAYWNALVAEQERSARPPT